MNWTTWKERPLTRFLLILLVITFLPSPPSEAAELVNPTFAFSQGSTPATFKVTFTSDVNAASYTVKIYDSYNTFSISRLTIVNYISGDDISGSICNYTSRISDDNFCYGITAGRTFKATITVNPYEGVPSPSESEKSNAIGILNAVAPNAGANTNIQSQSGLYFNFSSADSKATSATLYLYRTNEGLPTSSGCTVNSGGSLDTLNQTITGLAITSSTFVALEGKYCYTWSVKYIGSSTPSSENVTWYDSRVSSIKTSTIYSPQVISAPTNLIATAGDKEISLTWTAPAGTTVAVENYKVEILTDGGYWFYPYLTPTGQTYPFIVGGSATSAVIAGYLDASTGALKPLVNGTPYYIRIKASGVSPNNLQSSWLNYSATATPATPPAELPSGGAVPKDGAVDFVWTAPTDNGGSAVTGYIGEFSTDTVTWSAGFNVGASTLAATISGLINGTLYYFRIAAKNIMGTSSQWSPLSATPVTKSSQTNSFDFTNLGNKYYGNSPFDVSSYAHASSSGSQTFSSDTTEVCTVTGSIVTIVSVGTCTINAIQLGNEIYAPSPSVQQSFEVGKASQSISLDLSTLSVRVNDSPINISSYVSSTSGLTNSLISSTTGICTISGFTLTVVSYGTCTITASQSGNTNYNAATQVSQSITIGKLTQTITFSLSTFSKKYGDSAFDISATSSSSLSVSFSSSTTSVCTISGSSLTILSAGTCTIAANQAGNSSYAAAVQVSQNLTIAKINQSITFSLDTLSAAKVGDTPFGISSYASSDSGLSPTFTSSTTAVCTIASSTITLLTAGTCTIAADQSGNTNYNAASQVVASFTAGRGNQTITFSLSSFTKKYGDSPFNISASSSASLAITLNSSTTSVCTISGVSLTILSAGTCTIAANQAGGTNYSAAAQVTSSLTVGKADQSITFVTLTNKSYGSVAFDIPVHPTSSSSLVISYVSSTTSICTNDGPVITILGVGTCTIAASQAGNTNYNAAPTVSQSFLVTKGSQVIVFPDVTDRTLISNNFVVTVSATSGLSVTLASTTGSTCSVSTLTVTLKSVGTCTVVASQSGNTLFEAASSVTHSFEINGKIDSLLTNFPDENRTYGEAPFIVSAPTSNVAGTFTYSTSNSFFLPISGGVATIGYVGSVYITATFTPSAPSTYNGSSITKVVTVAPAAQSALIIAAAAGHIQSGLSLSTTGGTGFGNVSFALVSSPDCTLLSFGYLTRTTPGNCVVVATKESDGFHFAIDSPQATITFTKETQSISFSLASYGSQAYGSWPISIFASSNSGLSVTLTSTDTTICTISDSSLSFLKVGSCEVTASQTGNEVFSAASSVTESISITKKALTVSTRDLDITAGDTFDPALLQPSFVGFITYPSLETISNLSGSFACVTTYTTSSAAGTYSITCSGLTSLNYDITYTPATLIVASSSSLTPGAEVQALSDQTVTFDSLNSLNKTISDAPFSIVSFARSSSGLNLIFTTQSQACSISKTGVVTVLTTGTCIITASAGSNGSYNASNVVERVLTIGSTPTPTPTPTPAVTPPVVVYVPPSPVPYLKTLSVPKMNLKDGKAMCTRGTYNAGYTLAGIIQGSSTALFSPSSYVYNLLINGVTQTSLVVTTTDTSVLWDLAGASSGSIHTCSVTVNSNSITITDKSTDNSSGVIAALLFQTRVITEADVTYKAKVKANTKAYPKALVDNRKQWIKEIAAIRANFYVTLDRIKAKGGSKMIIDVTTAYNVMVAAKAKSDSAYSASKPAAIAARNSANKAALDAKTAAIAKANATYGAFLESIGYGILVP
jgi:hypothetical protein